MYKVFYYDNKLGKWIMACTTVTEQAAKDQCAFLKKLWGDPTKYEKE